MRAEPLVGEDRHRRFERIKAAANRYATYESHLGLMYQSVLS